jgi:predicted dehydrogenase
MKNVLLIGVGKWGQNYLTTLSNFDNVSVKIANRNNWKQLIDENPDGVMVCTPPQSHIEIAERALRRDIPTMIEKPLCLSSSEAASLSHFTTPILINNINLFSQSYEKMRSIINTMNIDKIVSLNYNNGPIRDYSSLYDYGSHDLAMILDLTQQMPRVVSCNELITKTGSLFNIKMNFQGCETETLVGNGGSKRVRKLKIIGGGLGISYDDKLRPTTHTLPLERALQVFLRAIDGHLDPRLGIDLSVKVLNILDMCLQKYSNNYTLL